MARATIEVTLPEPPSANRYYRHARGRTYRSAEATAYIARVFGLVRNSPMLSGPVRVTMTWYRSKKMGDLDNRAKVVFDALNGLVWGDDAQVVEIHMYRQDRPKDGALHLIAESVDD